MKKTFFKNLYRDIKKSISRFLSIVVIITVGTAFYAGVRATSPDMKMSEDNYFTKNNFMDFKLISTLGLTENDAAEIRKLSGVTQVQGSYSMDAVIEKDNGQLVLNIDSLPDESGINSIKIIRGRRAEKPDEVVVEEKFFKRNKLKLNDRITLKSGNESSIEDSLKNSEFIIVGTAQSPLYISEQRQLSSVGNGSVSGFVYILPEVFKSDVFSEIYVRTDSSQSQRSMTDNEKYSSYVESMEKSLKDLSVSRNEIRYADVIKTADDKLSDAQAKLDSSKKEAEEKFADGYKQLNDAMDKLLIGRQELIKNEALFNQRMSAGKKQIEGGRGQIVSAQKVIDTRKKEIENGKLQLADTKKQLDIGEAKLKDSKKQAAENISSAISAEVDKAGKLMESDPENQVSYR
jgi:putative ABC transport system permease protein